MIDGVGGGKKSGEKNFFFSDVAKKLRENVAEKCGEEKTSERSERGSRTSLLKRVVSL